MRSVTCFTTWGATILARVSWNSLLSKILFICDFVTTLLPFLLPCRATVLFVGTIVCVPFVFPTEIEPVVLLNDIWEPLLFIVVLGSFRTSLLLLLSVIVVVNRQ